MQRIQRELLENGENIIGLPIKNAEACIFPDNIASQRAFKKQDSGTAMPIRMVMSGIMYIKKQRVKQKTQRKKFSSNLMEGVKSYEL